MHAASLDVTYAGVLGGAVEALKAAGVGTPRLDAEVLLSAALRGPRSAVYAKLRDPVSPPIARDFNGAVARRCLREPVAYITGEQEFWSLPFAVDRNVLIPRPETELLVESALRLLSDRPSATVCDLGTGSGCIAVALAHALPRLRVLAVDLSPRALGVARRNITRHAVGDRVWLACTDVLTAIAPSTRFDVIVSNPPYVGRGEAVTPEVEWEPFGAVRSGGDGLDAIRRLLDAAPRHLSDDGWLLMEFGAAQEVAVRALAGSAGFGTISVIPDLAGLPRVLVAGIGPGREAAVH